MISDIAKQYIKCSQTCCNIITEKTILQEVEQASMFAEGGDRLAFFSDVHNLFDFLLELKGHKSIGPALLNRVLIKGL